MPNDYELIDWSKKDSIYTKLWNIDSNFIKLEAKHPAISCNNRLVIVEIFECFLTTDGAFKQRLFFNTLTFSGREEKDYQQHNGTIEILSHIIDKEIKGEPMNGIYFLNPSVKFLSKKLKEEPFLSRPMEQKSFDPVSFTS